MSVLDAPENFRTRLLLEIRTCERDSPVKPWVGFRTLPAAEAIPLDDLFNQLEILRSEGRVELKVLRDSGGVQDGVVKLTGMGRKHLEETEAETDSPTRPAAETTALTNPSSHGLQQSQMAGHHPKAFVSHSTQDHPFVERFATDLRQNGVDAWYSGWEIKPGDSIRAKIDEGLEGCEYFIIVLSKSSINRPWVRSELDAATVRKLSGKVRKIIPVKIENCGDLPPTLASLCWEDFSNQPHEAALKRVLDSIFGVDVRPPLGQPPRKRVPEGPKPVPVPVSERKERPTHTQFPISALAMDGFLKHLRREGFDARGDVYNGQVGIIVGPGGLDPKRMPPDEIGIFFPLWELNHESNRPLIEARRFHEIVESRPENWQYNRPYQKTGETPGSHGEAQGVGRGKGAAERLKEQAEAEEQRRRAQTERARLTEQNRNPNWDALVAALQRDVSEFAESFPRAKNQQLRADLLNTNNLTIQTAVQPILKIEVIRDYGYKGVQITATRQRGWEFAEGQSPIYEYIPEGFTDGSRAYSPEEFATEIFEHVVNFFSPEQGG